MPYPLSQSVIPYMSQIFRPLKVMPYWIYKWSKFSLDFLFNKCVGGWVVKASALQCIDGWCCETGGNFILCWFWNPLMSILYKNVGNVRFVYLRKNSIAMNKRTHPTKQSKRVDRPRLRLNADVWESKRFTQLSTVLQTFRGNISHIKLYQNTFGRLKINNSFNFHICTISIMAVWFYKTSMVFFCFYNFNLMEYILRIGIRSANASLWCLYICLSMYERIRWLKWNFLMKKPLKICFLAVATELQNKVTFLAGVTHLPRPYTENNKFSTVQ